MSPAHPDISVVIPTIPSSDHSHVKSLLEKQNFDGELQICIINDLSLNRCEARNLGLQKANASIVAFTDDDTAPPADWLSSIYQVFEDNPDLDCIEGSVTGGINYSGIRQYIGCNIAVKKEAALDVGGWSSRYAGWREDTEFGWRMEKEADGGCAFISAVRMVHPKAPRTQYSHELETLLKQEYPIRYAEVIDSDLQSKLWRYAQRIGIISHINMIRNILLKYWSINTC